MLLRTSSKGQTQNTYWKYWHAFGYISLKFGHMATLYNVFKKALTILIEPDTHRQKKKRKKKINMWKNAKKSDVARSNETDCCTSKK